jgi:hypothetical protein
MNLKCFYNYLSGKNLCNIFADIIVKELQKESPDVKTEISVINVGNFFVVKGRTSSNKIINITDLLTDYLSNLPNGVSENLRVIDTILYDSSFSFNYLMLNETFEKNSFYDTFTEFVNNHSSNNLFFNCKLDEQNLTILFDCDDKDKDVVKNLITKKFSDFKILKSDFSNETYVSDRFYGLSMNFEKPYHLLLRYIKNHLFQKGISSKLHIGINSDSFYDSIDNNNVNVNLSGSKLIVNEPWLESLILDVFPFKCDEIIEKLDLMNCDLLNDIKSPINNESSWLKLDLMSDIILY